MAVNNLNEILESLKSIKVYLRKIGPERRKKKILDIKIKEAKIIYEQFEDDFKEIQKHFADVPTDILSAIQQFSSEIRDTYSSILNVQIKESPSLIEMESFDLKTASSLLPMLNDSEDTTKQLIDATEFYDSMLKTDQKQHLIKFVLKTRLSPSAKLRLNKEYASTSSLVDDMKKHLLTIKSDTTLQTKLINSRQGNRSIESFGKSLEELFVDLTISQAKGDDNAYSVLKPINERNAIKQFADGLNNRRLSTIISARDFSSLKDAIRAALDEASASTSENIQSINHFQVQRGRKWQYRGSGRSRGPSHRFCGNNLRYNNNHKPDKFVGHAPSNDSTRNFAGRSRGQTQRTFNTRGRQSSHHSQENRVLYLNGKDNEIAQKNSNNLKFFLDSDN